MSQKKERRSARDGGKYRAQRVRTASNKLAACKRHVAKHPNDAHGEYQLLRRVKGII